MQLVLKINRQLSKAGREGLVPVERQVVRRGKAFQQIFYVRPSRAEAEAEAKKVQDPETFRKPPIQGGSPDNRPQGGFWIGVRAEGHNTAFRVPQKHISRVFRWGGHTFVIHRKLNVADKQWEAQYIISERSTGMSIGIAGNPDPDTVRMMGTQKLAEIGKPKLDQAVESGKNNLDEIPEGRYIGETDHWIAAEPITPEAREELVDHLVEFSDEAFERDRIKEWLEEFYEFDDTGDIEALKEEIQDQWVLEQAVAYGKTYVEAFEEEEAIADMVDVASGEAAGTISYEQVREWAAKHAYNLVEYSRDDWAVETSGGGYEEPAFVMAWAIEQDYSFEEAQQYMYERMRDDEREAEREAKEEEEGITAEEIPAQGEHRDYQDFTPAKREKLLSKNELAEKAYLGGGCNGSYWVRMEDGDDIEGVWKPAHEESGALRSNIDQGTYYLREAAAWEIDKAMKLNLVPPTVIQQIDGMWGSMQEFAGDAYTANEKSLTNTEAMYAASVFDFLTMNTDRHGANYMVSEDGKPILIDNGLILPYDERRLGNAFYDSHFYRSGTVPERIMKKVRKADWGKVVNWMVDHGIDDGAIDTFTQRVSYLKTWGTLPDSSEVGGYGGQANPWSDISPRSPDVMSPEEGAA